MNKRYAFKRKVKPDQVRSVLKKEGTEITLEQAVKVTDFIYCLAEILIKRELEIREHKESS